MAAAKATPKDGTKARTKDGTKAKAKGRPKASTFKPLDDQIPDEPLIDDEDGALVDQDEILEDGELPSDEDPGDDFDDDDLDDDELDEDADDDLENGEFDDDEFEAQLRRVTRAASGSPFKIRVRRLVSRGEKGGKLQPIRATLSAEDVAAAGGLKAAVARAVAGEPGSYVAEFVDPVANKALPGRRFITLADPAPSHDVLEIEGQTQKLKAKKKLVEAEIELEDLLRGRGKNGDDVVARAILQLEKRLARIEDGGSGNKWMPVLLALAPKLIDRLFQPPTAMLAHLGPAMGEAVSAAMQMRLGEQRAEQRRGDLVLEKALDMIAAQAGVEPEKDDSPLGMVKELVGLFRARSAAAPPVADRESGDVPPRRESAPERLTPFARFIDHSLRCAGRIAAEDAAERLAELWLAIPDAQRSAFLGDDQRVIGRLFLRCPAPMRQAVARAWSQQKVRTWFEELRAALGVLEDVSTHGPGDDAGDPIEAEVVEPEPQPEAATS